VFVTLSEIFEEISSKKVGALKKKLLQHFAAKERLPRTLVS